MRIYDPWDKNYKSKFGAISCGSEVTIRIAVECSLHPKDAILILFRPDQKERFIRMKPIGGDEFGICRFEVTFTLTNVGIHYYHFSIGIGDGRRLIKKSGANIGTFDGEHSFQLTVYDSNFKTPDVFKGGVMYQIFPDRFNRSGKNHDGIPTDRVIRRDWGGTPHYLPDENGIVRNNDYFGGDLDGIAEKLPYLKELGVDYIYLTPIFEAHENHRYNTADYLKVDPLLGTNDDFTNLCKTAAEYGMKVILDGVFSHTGADSVYFNKNGRYDSIGAYNSQDSPYSSWYTFHNFPRDYESWWGFDTLPNVNENDESYTEFICGEGGVLEYWIEQGASGYRLDVADELPDEFLDELRIAVKRSSEHSLIIGEVWEDASNKESYGIRRRYLLGEQLDSVMNYPFKEAILNYIKYANAGEFVDSIMTILENYPKPAIDVLMNSISTHDTERALTRIAGEDAHNRDKTWQAQYKLGDWEYAKAVAHLKCAMVLQFFLPGIPCIYYGDEIGMQGYRDPFNRGCFTWDAIDENLRTFTAELASIRSELQCMKEGEFTAHFATGDTFIFSRYDEKINDGVLIYLNKSHFKQKFSPYCELMKGYEFVGIIRGHEEEEIEIPPYDYAVIRIRR